MESLVAQTLLHSRLLFAECHVSMTLFISHRVIPLLCFSFTFAFTRFCVVGKCENFLLYFCSLSTSKMKWKYSFRRLKLKLFATIAVNHVSFLFSFPLCNDCKTIKFFPGAGRKRGKLERKSPCTHCIIRQHMLLMPFDKQRLSGKRANKGENCKLEKVRLSEGLGRVRCVCKSEGGNENTLKWFINHLHIQITIKSVSFDITPDIS